MYRSRSQRATQASARRRRLSQPLWKRTASADRHAHDSEESEHDEFGASDEKACHELYEPECAAFEVGQTVWIRLQDVWYRGTVRRITQTEQSKDRSLRYDVHFRHRGCTTNMKACFDPLNGNIKPDTPRIRALLRAVGAAVGSAPDA